MTTHSPGTHSPAGPLGVAPWGHLAPYPLTPRPGRHAGGWEMRGPSKFAVGGEAGRAQIDSLAQLGARIRASVGQMRVKEPEFGPLARGKAPPTHPPPPRRVAPTQHLPTHHLPPPRSLTHLARRGGECHALFAQMLTSVVRSSSEPHRLKSFTSVFVAAQYRTVPSVRRGCAPARCGCAPARCGCAPARLRLTSR